MVFAITLDVHPCNTYLYIIWESVMQLYYYATRKPIVTVCSSGGSSSSKFYF